MKKDIQKLIQQIEAFRTDLCSVSFESDGTGWFDIDGESVFSFNSNDDLKSQLKDCLKTLLEQ